MAKLTQKEQFIIQAKKLLGEDVELKDIEKILIDNYVAQYKNKLRSQCDKFRLKAEENDNKRAQISNRMTSRKSLKSKLLVLGVVLLFLVWLAAIATFYAGVLFNPITGIAIGCVTVICALVFVGRYIVAHRLAKLQKEESRLFHQLSLMEQSAAQLESTFSLLDETTSHDEKEVINNNDRSAQDRFYSGPLSEPDRKEETLEQENHKFKQEYSSALTAFKESDNNEEKLIDAQKKFKTSIECLSSMEKVATTLEDKAMVHSNFASCYRDLGKIQIALNNPHRAQECLTKALDHCTISEQMKCTNKINKKKEECEELLSEIQHHDEKEVINHNDRGAQDGFHYGPLFSEPDRKEKTLEQENHKFKQEYSSALTAFKESDNNEEKLIDAQKKFKTSIECLSSMEKVATTLEDKAMVHSNFASCYRDLGKIQIALNDPHQAREYLTKALNHCTISEQMKCTDKINKKKEECEGLLSGIQHYEPLSASMP